MTRPSFFGLLCSAAIIGFDDWKLVASQIECGHICGNADRLGNFDRLGNYPQLL